MVDPNIAYLVLVFGIWAAITAVYVPGTGIVEGISLVTIIAAIGLMSGLPMHWWAVLLIIVGLFSFHLLPLINQKLAHIALIGLAVKALGAVLLFDGLALSPLIIVVTVGVAFIYHTYALVPLLGKVRGEKSLMDDSTNLEGAYGRVNKTFTPQGKMFTGSVHVRGESWTASSEKPLDTGDDVIVVERDGLELLVEGLKHKESPQPNLEEA